MLPEMNLQITGCAVPEIDSPTKLPNLVSYLVARGYAKEAIRKILGLNFLRVFGEVWL
jgi:membrane dipeptidase